MDRAFSGHEDFTYVLSDSYGGMYQAVNLMLEKGCRHPYCIMRDNSNVDSTSQDNAGRYNGFIDALRNNGITQKTEDLTILIPSHGDSAQLAEQAIVDFLKKGKPVDCIAAFSDNEALGVIRGLKKSGLRVPDDVMVFGFDNVSESAICSPTLSTVGRFNEKIARIAAEKLYERIQDPSKDIPEKIILPVEVIERESTAK